MVPALKPEMASLNIGSTMTGRYDFKSRKWLSDFTLSQSYSDLELIARTMLEAGTKPEIEIDHGHSPTLSGDMWLLCSDGLTDELNDEQIAAVLERAANAESAVEECVHLALESGGRDNVSVAVTRIISGSTETGSEEIPRPETYPPPQLDDRRDTDTGSGLLSRLSRRLRGVGDEGGSEEPR